MTVFVVIGVVNAAQTQVIRKINRSFRKHWKTSFGKKNCFIVVGEYVEYGFDQQRLIWYVFRLCQGYGV